jgi:hypothetical protein
MAGRIAILGGEPYEEWIKRDGQAQRLFKAYCDKWPDGTVKCAAIGADFYVRFENGEMRHVDCVGDFDDEAAWCAQCGVPVDIDGGEYYCCDADGCGAVLCDCCGGSINYYCPRHRLDGMFQDGREPEYIYPYAFGDGNQFTFGVEIELESELSEDFVENVADSELIAGWENDQSLDSCGVELQTNILDMSKLSDLRHLIDGIPEYGENAGGHIHVARTPNQCASRWYWALHGLDATQCQRLNMRHMSDGYWCELRHGDYCGKHVAINDEHQDTIELRTFDCWFEGSAAKLVPAVKWIRAMWRFFEKHPRGTVSSDAIERYSSCMADNVTDTPRRTLAERLEAARRYAAARKEEEERERVRRADETRRRVEKNVMASRRARESHGDTTTAVTAWREHENHREHVRKLIEERLSDDYYNHAFPSRNLQPLHQYMRMVAARIECGYSFNSLGGFHLRHAYSDETLWFGFEYLGRHGHTATRVIDNIIRSRIARASHGTPTREPLERAALRLYKRAGRPELNERYAQIRKRIARGDA